MRIALKRWFVGLSLGSVLLVLDTQARAQSRLEWDPSFRSVSAPEYVTTGLAGGGYLLMRFVVAPSRDADWTEPLLFDAFVRRQLRFRDGGQRHDAATISDILLYSLIVQSAAIDTLVVPGLIHRNGDVTWQLSVINAQSYAISLLLNTTTKRLLSRMRPYAAACGRDPNYHPDCRTKDAYRSFYSNHSSLTSTGAGLICVHHQHLDLYGGLADPLACAGAVTLAVLTGALRIAADEHWATDVLTGFVIGALSGYVLPRLRYYEASPATVEANEMSGSVPVFPLSLQGRF